MRSGPGLGVAVLVERARPEGLDPGLGRYVTDGDRRRMGGPRRRASSRHGHLGQQRPWRRRLDHHRGLDGDQTVTGFHRSGAHTRKGILPGAPAARPALSLGRTGSNCPRGQVTRHSNGTGARRSADVPRENREGS